jgi:hypothetical protein
MEKQLKEEKQIALRRVPPGDKWVFDKQIFDKTPNETYPTLTDALEAWYQLYDDTEFYIDARRGIVEVVSIKEIVIPTRRFSLYGEE